MKIKTLGLENNAIVELKLPASTETLFGFKNRLKTFFINKEISNVRIDNNEITNLTIKENSALLTLDVSHNPLGDNFFPQMRNAGSLETLYMSNTSIKFLSAYSFADLKNLVTLKLDQNSIFMIDYGFFAHQMHLKYLNISYNSLNIIDLHTLASLESLQTLDISFNLLTSINYFENLNQFLPQLIDIGLEGNLWNCKFLAKFKASQNVTIIPPFNPIKNSSNFMGISCSNNVTQITPSTDGKTDEKQLNLLIDKVNELSKVNEVKSKENLNLKSLVDSLQRDMMNLKSDALKHQLSAVNSSNANDIREIVDQINNVTLENQRVAREQLMRKIDEQNSEIAQHKMEIEKLTMMVKGDTYQPQSMASQTPTLNSSLTALETVLLTLLVVFVSLAIIFGVYKVKKFFVMKLDRIARQRVSRRNSISTIVTYDNTRTQQEAEKF